MQHETSAAPAPEAHPTSGRAGGIATWICGGALLAFALLLLLRLASIWRARFGHPFDLEWMEGAMLVHSWRIEQDLPLYVEPGVDFIPFVYPPGYPVLVAALSSVFGLDYEVGRGVSLAATLLAAAAIGFLVLRLARSPLAAALGAAVFLGTYAASGLFFDLVRVDALALALAAWAIALASVQHPTARVASALLVSLATMVKLQSVVFGLPLLLAVWRRDGTAVALRYALVAALPACALAAWMQWQTGGLFLRWLVAAPAAHGLVWPRLLPGTPAELGAQLPVPLVVLAAFTSWQAWSAFAARGRARFAWLLAAVTLAAAALGAAIPVHPGVGTLEAALGTASCAALLLAGAGFGVARGRAAPPSAALIITGGTVGVALLSSAFSRAHFGGYLNVLMPIHWALALGFACVVGSLLPKLPQWGVAALCGLAALQLALQAADLDAEQFAPSAADREAGEWLVAALRERPGPVLSPFAPWVAVQAGHAPSLHLLGITENTLSRSAFPETRQRFEAAVEAAHWETVVAGNVEIGFGLEQRYEFDAFVESAGRALWPRSGYRVRPETIMVPRR